jgi:DNA-directed RNA polymerase subunit RPC12/RpoP
MSEICRLVVEGIPRTKKNSPNIVHIPGKRTEEYRKCSECGQEVGRASGFNKLLPSDAFKKWLDEAILQAPAIRFALQKAGVKLPIDVPVSVKMLIFRKAAVGDLFGYYDAIADGLQAPMYAFPCAVCKKKTLSPTVAGVKCSECRRPLHQGRQSREGMGIILDDSQIKSTDGSRLLKDSARPRVEITIATFDEEAVQEGLFAAEEPSEAPPIAPPAKIVPAKLPSRGLLTPDDPDY